MKSKTRKFEKHLKCMFTEAEVKQIADDLSNAVQTANEKEAAKKAIVAQANSDLELAKSSVSSLACKHRDKYEYRTVKCEETRDYDLKRLTSIRLDTGEEIENRPLTTEELQIELEIESRNASNRHHEEQRTETEQ